jgi:hypothetical protein
LVEQLESRQLMAADSGNYPDWINPAQVAATADFADLASYNAFRDAYSSNLGGGGGTGGGLAGEGGGFTGNDDNQVVSELEPNNQVRTATKIPLGFGAGQQSSITLQGSLPFGDEDYFLVKLSRGDILNLQANGAAGDISVGPISSNGLSFQEWIGNDIPSGGVYSADSPLLGEGNASLAINIEADGIYVIRVGTGPLTVTNGSYTLDMRVYRAPSEQLPVGTVQTLFLDFDGGFVNMAPFGGDFTARVAPLAAALPGLGLLPRDLNTLIDRIVATVKENFGDVARIGTNGDYEKDGTAGNYGLQILNSRDHADPWGLPNVSRIVIAGNSDFFPVPGIFGVAQSVDVGNFGLEETAFTFANNFDFYVGAPIAASTSYLQLFGELIGNTTSHEAGHFYGNWHTDPFNDTLNIMDNFGDLRFAQSTGNDGVWGTPDDLDPDFAEDVYSPIGSNIRYGINDTLNNMSGNLPTGLIGGTIKGTVFQDANRNRKRESGEKGLSDIEVYADINGNLVRDPYEPGAKTKSNGAYEFRAPKGTYSIRVTAPETTAQTQPVNNGGYKVNLAVDQVISGQDFGIVQLVPDITGFKWEDTDGNGAWDEGEKPISGIYIYADMDGDNRIDIGEPQTVTRADGSYKLILPKAGSYAIREVLPAGYAQSFPGPDAGNEHSIVFSGVQIGANLNFGNRLASDFGDAPNSYGTTLANNGARHGLLDGFGLGVTIRDESDARTPLDGTGEGNEEDGVTFLSSLLVGTSDNRLQLNLRNTAGVIGYAQGWIDFNRDGVFDASEQIIKDLKASGANTVVTFDVPSDARQGTTYARFRYSTARGLSPNGAAVDGEVEDYKLIIGDPSSSRLLAVDDSETTSIPVSQSRTIDVLRNDFFGPAGTFASISVGASQIGAKINVFDNGTPSDPTDDRLIYEAPASLGGVPGATDQFTYTLVGLDDEISTAIVTVQVGNAGYDDIVSLRLVATDNAGNPIDRVAPGDKFKVQLYVQDLRGPSTLAPGVFAAFGDVLFDSKAVSTIANSSNAQGFNVTYGPDYRNNPSGDVDIVGLINELGAVQSNTVDPLGSGELLLATFDMVASQDANGLTEIKLDPADLKPFSDTLLFDPPTVVPIEQIRFTPTSITIGTGGNGGGGGEGDNQLHNGRNSLDVNNDGFISPIDALGVINFLNRGRFGGGEGEGGSSNLFVDVNNDRLVSALDALMVINYLNRRSGGGEGEGEGEGGGLSRLAGAVAATNAAVDTDSASEETSSTDAVFNDLGASNVKVHHASSKQRRETSNPALSSQPRSSFAKSISDYLALDVFQAWKNRRRG